MRMDTGVINHLLALSRSLPEQIAEDTREIELRQTRLEKNKELLAYVRNTLPSYRSNGRSAPDLLTAAIERLPIGPVTVSDIIAAANEIEPDREVTAKEVARVLYRLTKEGRIKGFTQTTKGGGKVQPIYEKAAPAAPRTRTRPVPLAESLELNETR